MAFQFAPPGIWLFTRPFVWSYRVANRVFDFDKRGAANNLKKLMGEVQSDCGELFRRYGGRIIPELSKGSASFDWASVVVEVRSLQLEATRDRGFTGWKITAPGSHYPWQPLDLVCQRFAASNKGPYSSFQLLRDHLPEIERLFASENWIPPMRP